MPYLRYFCMVDKVTSIKIDSELWRRAKLLAVKRGVTLRSILEDLLLGEVRADEFLGDVVGVRSSGLMEVLEGRRRSGLVPFTITSSRRAVDIVREQRDG